MAVGNGLAYPATGVICCGRCSTFLVSQQPVVSHLMLQCRHTTLFISAVEHTAATKLLQRSYLDAVWALGKLLSFTSTLTTPMTIDFCFLNKKRKVRVLKVYYIGEMRILADEKLVLLCVSTSRSMLVLSTSLLQKYSSRQAVAYARYRSSDQP